MSQCFGIIPAAGHSRRMGTNKLLLPWRNSTIIQTVLRAWCNSRVDRIIIVLRKDDEASQTIVSEFGVDIVLPESDPVDMKRSVQVALEHIQSTYLPADDDAWMLAPADLPTLQMETINQLVFAAKSGSGRIIVPYHGEKRGHPVVFPFSKTGEVFQLDENQGVNALLDQNEFTRLAVNDVIFGDVDTPSDYQRIAELDREA